MRALARIFISWLPLAIAVTGLSLLVFLGAQQVIRQGFNDVSVQIAEDTVAKLNAGAPLADVIGTNIVDIRHSIAPFVTVYDKDGVAIAGTGMLDTKIPTPPHGVFENVDFWRYGHSWQPDSDVRIDAAIIAYTAQNGTGSGFVLGGRNMRLMQDHIVHIGWFVLQAWITLMVATFIAKGFARYFS